MSAARGFAGRKTFRHSGAFSRSTARVRAPWARVLTDLRPVPKGTLDTERDAVPASDDAQVALATTMAPNSGRALSPVGVAVKR